MRALAALLVVAACGGSTPREELLKVDPFIDGTAALSFEVDGAGRVQRASAQILPDHVPRLASCIERLMGGWTFTPADSGRFALTLNLSAE
jgi:hypothetical protein